MALFRVSEAPQADAAALGVQGMAAGTSVLTLEGALPVDFLSPGDRVVTRSGSRRIARVEVTVIRNARMVRVAAGSLGVDRPPRDLLISAAQGILLRDWRAKALYGAAQAVVPAARLCDGEHVRAEIVAEARLYTLIFEEPCVVYADGLELTCPGLLAKV